jgi:hypothetical protein
MRFAFKTTPGQMHGMAEENPYLHLTGKCCLTASVFTLDYGDPILYLSPYFCAWEQEDLLRLQRDGKSLTLGMRKT